MGKYNEIFQEVEAHLRANLPANLKNFKLAGGYDFNWMRVRYKEFLNSMYELQFYERSKTHKEFFGTAHLDIMAFYFGKNVRIKYRYSWLDQIDLVRDTISERLGMPVVTGEWNENWVWIAVCLQKEPVDRDVLLYAQNFTRFIEETYTPIKNTFKAIGYRRTHS